MNEQHHINYKRIVEAIDYLQQHFKSQPSLEEVAGKVHLSPFHFQRMFTDWAGTSPKKFLQYISIEYAKRILKDDQSTLLDAAYETGLSGTGRLHDLFVNIEGMTPAEYKSSGKSLVINYSWEISPFGDLLIASTAKGVCYMAFAEEEGQGLATLVNKFSKANLEKRKDVFQQDALSIFRGDWSQMEKVRLHLKATPFQLKVWETLLKIPMGRLSTYGSIAKLVGSPNASRAVGTAIGSNPVAFLIPCHRVIQSSGALGGYMWGLPRKRAIMGWEAAQVETLDKLL